MAIYLQIDYSSGNIFRYSKTEQEGYEPHTNTKGVVSYRQIFKKGLYGKLKGVSLRESDFGKEVSLAVEDKTGEINYLNMPLFDAKKNLASYAESFITVLPQLKIGNPYRFFAYNIKEEGQKYSKTGISVLPANLETETVNKEDKLPKLTYTFTKDGEETKGDIPAVVWEEDFDGSKTMNAKAKNKYLYDVLMANLSDTPKQEQAKPTPQTTAEASSIPVASPSQEFEPATASSKVEHDDLPFN